MLSMSDMKHDAIVDQGIPILERVPIPDEMIPEDGRVEIDAKIHAGYCKFKCAHFRRCVPKLTFYSHDWQDHDDGGAVECAGSCLGGC
jgi:hypothetical protein